jgi:hypothetical protein
MHLQGIGKEIPKFGLRRHKRLVKHRTSSSFELRSGGKDVKGWFKGYVDIVSRPIAHILDTEKHSKILIVSGKANKHMGLRTSGSEYAVCDNHIASS